MKNISIMSPPICYCGQKGDSTLNMLECIKCGKWFHEDCTKCLDLPMLFGDRFYIFICSICNAGSECLGRLELQWLEITHLLLYNLSVLEKKKYFHIDDALVPYLEDNWERFHILGPIASEKKDIRDKLLENLHKCQTTFKCGKEVKKCKSIFALRVRVPPDPPDVLPSGARLQKDVVVWDFQVKDRAYHIITHKKSTKSKEHCKNGKSKSKLHASSSTRQKNEEVSKCRESMSHSENGIHKTKLKNKRTIGTFSEDSAQLGLLDTLIPSSSFNNYCNPFISASDNSRINCPASESIKTSLKRRKRKRKPDSFDLTVANGDHHISDESCSAEARILSTKEPDLQNSKDFCIVGKRTSSTGKVQYLFQKNSEENVFFWSYID